MTGTGLFAGSVLILTVLSSGAARAQGDPDEGERLFTQCATCHSLEPGENRVGPTLAGVFGREAGAVEGFNYSDAMENADVVWSEETLDAFLADPQGYIPGNRMIFRGMPDEQDRQDLIAYLKEATQEMQ